MVYAKASVRAMVGLYVAIDTRYGKFCEYRPGNLKISSGSDLAGSAVVRSNRASYNHNNGNRRGKGFLNSKSHGGAYSKQATGTTAFFGIKRTNLSTGTYSHQNRSLQGGHGNFTVGQRGMVLSSAQDALKRKRHGERFASQLQKKIEQKGLDRLGVGQRNIAKFYNAQGNGTSAQSASYRKTVCATLAKRVMNGGVRLQKSASQELNRRSRGDPLGNMLQRANDRANMAIARKLRAAGIVIEASDPNDPNGINGSENKRN